MPTRHSRATAPYRSLSGWGRTAPSWARVHRPGTVHGVVRAVEEAASDGRGIIARGLGRSYGDSAQNGGGHVVDTAGLRRIRCLDPVVGTVRCEAGVPLGGLMARLLPLGWWLPAVPGTRYVSVGGAIASDVHGKNHRSGGSFGNHVSRMSLLTADGTIREVSPERDPDLFWATVGGMGLTGVVLDATLRLTGVETSRLVVDTERAADLDRCMDLLDAHEHTVAWIDTLADGRRFGRSVVTSGRFATRAELPARLARNPLAFAAKPLATVPDLVPGGLLNRLTGAAYNALRHHAAPRRRHRALQNAGAFFQPLDSLREWNRLYGRTGFVQYQFAVPEDRADTVAAVLDRLRKNRVPAFLVVLKKLGPGNDGHLSFPRPGWTLAFDVPARTPELTRFLHDLDAAVLEAGGRVYLAKDARLPGAAARAMYPRLERFRAVRDAVDPAGLFVSDQARRLGL
ncbi:FAD-binding oxidoreductase [Streptomyces javensis]|uniref:FAD-binding oxidoreductase n=1 Tax=Streptomyces javensis TaxID=114698 RepID=UPI0033E5249B